MKRLVADSIRNMALLFFLFFLLGACGFQGEGGTDGFTVEDKKEYKVIASPGEEKRIGDLSLRFPDGYSGSIAWLATSLASPPSRTPVSANPEMGSWTIKRCNPWRCKDAGSTCGGPPFCYGDYTPYQCLSRFNLTECSRLCWYEDIYGRRLGDPLYEEEMRKRHAGCCNICNMRHQPEVKSRPIPRPCFSPLLAPSAPPSSSSWFLPILARECDQIVHSECRYTLWRNTGFEYCSFSFWCILALPPFSGHFVEQEREQICWNRCKNGYTYTAVYHQRRSLLVGCCGGGLPLKRGGEPYRGLPGGQEEPFRIPPEEKR